MSFNSAFLSPTPPSARERDAERAIEEHRAHVAAVCYRRANFLVLATMVLLAVPQLGLAAWSWHMVGGVGLVVTVLAVVMMIKGKVWSGVLSLIFAWGILPGWVLAAPHVVKAAQEQYRVIVDDWRRSMRLKS
ncbi:MAG: hypothetical protein U0984_15745 [Prosthecobacter sp.]|nr:hypothetical protein [Prosthecobacter sp.]